MIQMKPIATVSKHCVSILFLDVVGFSSLRGTTDAAAVFAMLEQLMGACNALASLFGVERIDNFDGCYFAATNYSNPQPDDHAIRLARFALAAISAASEIALHPGRPELGAVQLRAGLHCGPVCGAVVGLHGSRKHTLHGDTVNVASRMQSHGAPGAVRCSAPAAALIEAQGGFGGSGQCLVRKEDGLDVKGLGLMTTFLLSPGAGNGPN